MNREIEFRGQCVLNGEWLYGDLEYSRKEKDVVRIHTYNDDGSYKQQCLVVPDSVGQFSGLVDKNGVKIFEGDIVLWDRDQKMYVVVFRNGMYYASVEECNPHIYGGFPLWYLCEQEQQCTIAGNIYENPELLSTK